MLFTPPRSFDWFSRKRRLSGFTEQIIVPKGDSWEWCGCQNANILMILNRFYRFWTCKTAKCAKIILVHDLHRVHVCPTWNAIPNVRGNYAQHGFSLAAGVWCRYREFVLTQLDSFSNACCKNTICPVVWHIKMFAAQQLVETFRPSDCHPPQDEFFIGHMCFFLKMCGNTQILVSKIMFPSKMVKIGDPCLYFHPPLAWPGRHLEAISTLFRRSSLPTAS